MRHATTFAAWFGIGPVAGKVCAALYAADTRALTVCDLTGLTGHAKASVRAGLVALRGAVEPGEIISDGLRYALTETGMDDCNAAIADARSRRLSA